MAVAIVATTAALAPAITPSVYIRNGKEINTKIKTKKTNIILKDYIIYIIH
jgi:hypothetical protein